MIETIFEVVVGTSVVIDVEGPVVVAVDIVDALTAVLSNAFEKSTVEVSVAAVDCGAVKVTPALAVDAPGRFDVAVKDCVDIDVSVVDVSPIPIVVLSVAVEEVVGKVNVEADVCGTVVATVGLMVDVPIRSAMAVEGPDVIVVGVADVSVVLSEAGEDELTEVKVEAVDGGTVVLIAVLEGDIPVKVDVTVEEPVGVEVAVGVVEDSAVVTLVCGVVVVSPAVVMDVSAETVVVAEDTVVVVVGVAEDSAVVTLVCGVVVVSPAVVVDVPAETVVIAEDTVVVGVV
ncbi:MAG: hypothetical protein ACRCVK_12695, partial [Aeromonas veronii]